MNVASFLLRWATSPANVGAVLPSSSRLAEAMAQGVEDAERVVEVGAGTGAITRVLARRVPQSRLVLIEPHPQWAHGLALRYPEATVLAAPVQGIEPRLRAGLPTRTHILSSIPFRSLPSAIAREARNALVELVRESPQRRLVQFSYQPRAPFEAPDDMVWKLRRVVLGNLPPAGVWELRTRARGGSGHPRHSGGEDRAL